jgi:putative membrane protein
MSAPTSADDLAAGAPERLHPLFLLSGLTGSLRGMFGAYALIAYLLVSGRGQFALLGAIGLIVFTIVGVALYWTRFEYRVGANDIRIDSGIISRTHRSIPFDRIQDVDITQGPLQRLLGLARVTFETGGGSAGSGAEEGVLQAITLERAEAIRTLIRSRRAREVTATDAEAGAADEGAPVYALSVPRLILAGIFNFSLAVLAGLFGLSQTFGDALGFDPLSEKFWRDLLSAGDPVAQYAAQHRLAAVVAGLLLLILVGLLTGIVRTTVREFGFRLDRTDVGLRRRRGLFTRTDVTLPAKRAQAVVVATGPVREFWGWSELRLQSLARDEGGKGDHVLAPLAKDDEVNAILAELGWRPIGRQPAWTRVSSAYVWTRVIAFSPLLAILGLNLLVFLAAPLWVDETMRADVTAMILPGLIPILILFVLLLVAIAVRWLDWRRMAYAVDGDRLLVRMGWWRRRLLVLPFAKIQSIDLIENFITRWFGTSSLRLGVAGGGVRGHSIPAIPRADARQLRDQLLESHA